LIDVVTANWSLNLKHQMVTIYSPAISPQVGINWLRSTYYIIDVARR
jgi:hypothetical protein